jgi:NitT/TauT family transport system substrate-binding protein
LQQALHALILAFSAISFATSEPDKPRLRAVAAVMNRDASAIVTLASSGITRPAMLDRRTYASYCGRFEMNIVRQMIRNDGGAGLVEEVTPPKLGIWDTIVHGQYDSTWVREAHDVQRCRAQSCAVQVFMGWEGVQASRKGVQLNAFYLSDFKCPYGYTPILLGHPAFLASNSEATRTFLAVCARGFQFAAAHPREAARMMCEVSQHPTLADIEYALLIDVLRETHISSQVR